ncbi:hypothetical protein CDD83_2907 [Cordyceps sp. RAO-2017]|nr:hypothetical protein CDD83_2907 [Cordyceps sp. RAO-2017]
MKAWTCTTFLVWSIATVAEQASGPEESPVPKLKPPSFPVTGGSGSGTNTQPILSNAPSGDGPVMIEAKTAASISGPGTTNKGYLLRGDSRPPKDILKNGLKPQGNNLNLDDHLSFRGTSAAGGLSGGLYIPNFRKDAAVTANKEFAAAGEIPPEAIVGYWEVEQKDPLKRKFKINSRRSDWKKHWLASLGDYLGPKTRASGTKEAPTTSSPANRAVIDQSNKFAENYFTTKLRQLTSGGGGYLYCAICRCGTQLVASAVDHPGGHEIAEAIACVGLDIITLIAFPVAVVTTILTTFGETIFNTIGPVEKRNFWRLLDGSFFLQHFREGWVEVRRKAFEDLNSEEYKKNVTNRFTNEQKTLEFSIAQAAGALRAETLRRAKFDKSDRLNDEQYDQLVNSTDFLGSEILEEEAEEQRKALKNNFKETLKTELNKMFDNRFVTYRKMFLGNFRRLYNKYKAPRYGVYPNKGGMFNVPSRKPMPEFMDYLKTLSKNYRLFSVQSDSAGLVAQFVNSIV